MSLFGRWGGQVLRLTSGKFWRSFFGFDSHSGEVVTTESALQLDAVWACVKLVSETVGTLPCMVYEKDGATVAADHPLYELLHDAPNLDNTAVEFWEAVALSLLLHGNAFAEKKMNGGRLVAIDILHPEAVSVRRNERNERIYTVRDQGSEHEIPEGRIFHVRGLGFGGDVGISPIGVARQTLGSATAAEKTAGKMFANGMQLAGVLTSDQVLKSEQRKQLSEALSKFAGSEKVGKIAVFEAGLKYQQLTLSPEDAQMLETRRFAVEQICRWFGVPPIMIGHAATGLTTWGSGVEQIVLQFTKTGLRPLLKRIEAAVRRDLMTADDRKKIKVEFNMEGLLRGDSKTRAEFLSSMVQNGLMTRNEGRAYENRPPVKEGGDILTAQTNLAPLDQLGKATASPARSLEAAVQQMVEQALASRKEPA